MPGWLQAFTNVNPVTAFVDALRALCLGGTTAMPVLEALAWIGGLLLATVPAAILRYRHAPRNAATDVRRTTERYD